MTLDDTLPPKVSIRPPIGPYSYRPVGRSPRHVMAFRRSTLESGENAVIVRIGEIGLKHAMAFRRSTLESGDNAVNYKDWGGSN